MGSGVLMKKSYFTQSEVLFFRDGFDVRTGVPLLLGTFLYKKSRSSVSKNESLTLFSDRCLLCQLSSCRKPF